MLVSEGRIGRVFVVRLEDGDRLPDALEALAAEKKLAAGVCMLLGGAREGRLVTGPLDGEAAQIRPIIESFGEVHEMAALGTIFPDAEGTPRLHMHGSFGRANATRTGCMRQGVDVWRLAECVVIEVLDADMVRKVDPAFGFEVLTGR
ncbi:protein of unknown function DUF296 [Desulfovibrio sp. X2]|uniref:PPC domain-containing DNA-binding protein n=1 Tax=Desulfovibrio sp. X2 TaxID=941449 RepID=UPI00035872F4|nr:DUF296 domain-containing protein [Desulfovibrio sp. X2]EPR39357.1 protein of unknown function DUF296 [Desulfovibrio sp. X2]